MERTSCLQHQANSSFFVFYQDVLNGCKRVYQRAVSKKVKYPVSPHTLGATIRVLEVMTNRQRDALVSARGCEPGELDPCDFFLTVSYKDFCYWSLQLYSESSFQHALAILEEEGIVESRYVVAADSDGHALPGSNTAGLTVVTGFRDPAYSHVPKIKQYRLVIEKAQDLIDGTQGLPPSPPPSPPPSSGHDPLLTERTRMGVVGEETGAPETTNHTSAPSQGVPAEGVTSIQTMPQSHSTSPTVKLLAPPGKTPRGGLGKLPSPPRKTTSPPLGKLPAPPGKTPSNKESESTITREESLQKEGEESPSSSQSVCAIFSPLPLDSPWEPETIIALYKGIIGPIDACDLEASYHAAVRLIAATSSLHSHDARYRIESELHYMTDGDSPSWWVKGRAVRTPVRLWHVADHYAGQWQDLVGRGWTCATMPAWHEYMQAAVVNAEVSEEHHAAERHVEAKQIIVVEEAAPSKSRAAPQGAPEPPGMEQKASEALLAQIDQESPPSVQLGSRKSRGGGIVVLVGISASRIEALYDPSDWPALRREIEEREAAWQSRLAAMRAKIAAGAARSPAPRHERERRRVA